MNHTALILAFLIAVPWGVLWLARQGRDEI